MAIQDKAPDTPSRMRMPTVRTPAEPAAADKDTSSTKENTGAASNGAKRAIEEASVPALPNKRISSRGITQPPPPLPSQQNAQKVSSLTNPRISVAGAAVPKREPAAAVHPPRRAASDITVNQRLEDMERITRELQGKINESSSHGSSLVVQLQLAEARCAELEAAKCALETRVSAKEAECVQTRSELEEAQRRSRDCAGESELQMSRLKMLLSADLEAAHRERDGLRGSLEQCRASLELANGELGALRGTVARQSAVIVDLEAQMAAFRTKAESAELEARSKTESLCQANASIDHLALQMAALKEKLISGETARRKLHNDLQELKGNIRVFCRVRPLLPSESASPASSSSSSHPPTVSSSSSSSSSCSPLRHDGSVRVPGGHGIGEPEEICVEQTVEGATGNTSTRLHPFRFDKVFGPAATQSAVFDEIAQLVQSALDGYRVCIFAYGQTGSGKTYTMEGRGGGSDSDGGGDSSGGRNGPEESGVIPRAVQQIFDHAELLKERGWHYSLSVSFLEIYNETIRDLLAKEGPHHNSGSTSNNTAAANTNAGSHEIRHTGSQTIVTDTTVQPVTSVEGVLQLLAIAGKSRAVAETLCNDRSSRSHSVFTLRISGANSVTGETIEGLLNLIDLAGSERLAHSGSTGERLKETQAINKSLSALGDVIAAIAAREPHVPFRNSKLTYLLQNSLGGNCKTLMFVNVSPAAESVPETICSLRFATKVNSCHIGTARKHAK